MDPVFQRLGDVTIQRLDKPKDKVGLQGGGDTVDDESKEDPQQDVNTEDSQGIKRNFENLAGPSNKRTKFEFKKGLDESSIQSFSDAELTDYDSESEIESDEESEAIMKSQTQESTEVTSELETSTDFLNQLVDDPYQTEEAEEMKNPEEIKSEVDDYEYDIKEKLKEMGEISFETVKKGDKPKKSEVTPENEVSVTPAKKPVLSNEDEMNERKTICGNLRRNIREVMDETKLDESTLAAQRQEMERLRRVQEQQRILRDYQRQIQQERVISLLQGNTPKAGTSGARIGSTVLVKLPNGQTMTKVIKKPFELVKVPKSAVPPHKSPKSLIAIKKPPGNLTPSVSIAPVMKRPSQIDRMFSDTDSDSEDAMSIRPPMQKTKPKDPVTTIDISSDDDCIVVSESENDPSEDADEDPSNSGLHTNDEFNQLDGQGRVVVNVGHAEDEADVYVAPQIARIIKPHQIGGVRFLFDNVIESVNRFETSTGFGCILAHSMGLGKTLQIVCFSDIFLRHTPSRTILCIMPINTLQNWLAEYNMWLPVEEAVPNSPLSAHGEVRPRNFNLHVLNDSHKTLAARAKVIHEWKTAGGVLLIGYEQFRLLSLRKHPKSRKKAHVIEPVDDDKSKLLFDDVHEALVKPGPDLVICDEGHRIKNSHASISQALKQMRTKRRVVLTGYPLQNNLMEYWCMVDFVRPNYLGTKTEFCNMFERPIQNGQCIDSTEADIKLMRYRAHVLHSLLVGFVQRRSHTVLQTALPQKEEYVLLVRMTNFQRTLYETFMNEVVRTQTVPNPLKAFAVCCKIWNHPDVLYYFLKKQAGGEAVDIDLEEVSTATTTANETTAKPKKGSKKSTAKGKNASKPAASVTPYNSLGDATSKSTKKNQGKNNQNNANQVQPCPQANLTEPNPNYQAQSQNYPAKMDFEYSNSSGYGSNQSFGSSNFQQNQNYGETPSYPYSNQNTPSQPTYPVSGTPHSDTNIYPYQQNNNTNQNYQSDSQGYPANQNQNFEQKPNFHGKGNDFPQTQNQYPQNNPNQGSSYNNSNSNQSITYGQNSQNYHNQQPKGPYPQHQNNYPPNQQGPYPQTQDAYPQGEQENFRGSESNFSQQENAASFQNQQNPSAGYSGTTPYNNTQGNYGNQSVNSEYSNQSTLKHDGNRPGYSGYSNSSLGKGVYQENQGYPPQQQPSNVPQQQVPNVLQQPNVSQQLPCAPQQQQPKAPQLQTNSHNTQGYPQNSPAGYSTSNTHNMPPQSHTTPPHGHNHQQHMSPPQNPGVPYDPHPQGVAHPSNTAHLQTVSHPQNVHPQNLTHSQSAPHPQHTSHPQNIPPVHTSPHPQSTSQGSSSMYPQHHHNQENSLMGTGSNPGYSPQHHQGSVTIPQGMGHPQNVDGYPQNVGQSLASGGHPQNVGGHSQNIGHTQSIQHSQNAPHSQSVASYPQNVGHSQHVSNSQNIGIPQNVSASQNIGHSHNAGHHTGATQLGTNPNTSAPPQNMHSQQQIGGSPLQSIRDQPQNVSGHLQNVGGHNQSIGGQPGQHQHVSGQNLGGQHQNVSGQHQNVATNPQNMGYNPQNTGETSPNIAGNPHSFAGNSQNTGGPHHSSGHLHNTGHHPGNAQLHNIAGQQQSGTPLSNIGGQHSSIGAQHLSLGGQHSSSGGQHQSGGHHSLMSGPHQSQNIIGGNPVEPSQNVDRLQQNMVGGQHSHITGQHSNVSQQQSGGHAQSIASSNPIEHSQNVDRSQHNIAAGHNSQKQHGGNYGQDKYGGYSQNVAHSQTTSYSQNVNQPQSTGSQNLGHPQNLVHPQNSGHLQNVPPQSINHPQNVPPPQNSSPSQNVNPPQTASGNYQHNYPPQSPQPYPPNVTTPHYNSAPTPNPDNQNYPPTSDQQNSYPNSQGSQTQPPYQHSQGYQQQQPNAYQGNGQGEYRGNQYNETQYHGNASQNFPAGNSPKAYQSGAATPSYQTNQQNEEYSSTHSDSYPQNQPSNYPQQQSGYQNNSPNQPAGGYQQNQYSANYQGGNNNQTGNFSNNQTGGSNYNQNNPVQTTTNKDKGFPQGYKQEVPESPTNYSTNQNQQQSQFQPPANFQNYPNQQQSPYWNQDYNKQNENYNFKPPFNQNYQNQSQPWKKEDCGNKQSPAGSICPSPVKSENSCDSKPKINIISDIKLSGSSAYDMNKKINILSDIKLEPKKENEEFKEEIKLEVKNDTLKQEPSDDDIKIVEAAPATKAATKEDTGIPYDWAIELLKDYVPGIIENSAKMEILFCIIKESIALGDRLLVFSQSLITLDLIEQFLQMNSVPGETQHWAKNVNYYRLDGSTSALEREKLINEFNSNPKIYVFLVSTRAGSLGINLIGANRVVVLDASWNPCHDTQAVCRVYRYGQRKPCFVYRLVVDNCLEKKIYDRQINKQGMSDRVVDECNPDAHLTMKDVSTLCWDDKTEEGEEKDWSHYKDNYIDVVLQKVLVQYGKRLNKEPFQHESLLVDRKDKQLSQQEKRLAKKGYEREKQAARQPSYNVGGMSRGHRPVASVRPMQQGGERPTRWIPAEHWQRQGMTAQEMTLPLDVVIPTNQPDKGNIVLKAGQKVLVLKSPKGVYMQLESGKIVAIKTAIKVRGKVDEDTAKAKAAMKNAAISVVPQKRVVKPFAPNLTKLSVKSIKQSVPNLVSRMQTVAKRVQTAKTKPYNVGQEIARAVNQAKSETESHPSSSDEERTHGGEKRHFNFSKENMPLIDSKRSAQNSRNSSLDRREMSTDGEDAMPPVVVTPTLKPKNVKQSKGSMKNTTSALERLEQSASTIMAKNKQTFQESLDTITSTYAEDEKLSEASHSAPNQSSQSISSSSEPEVIPVDDAPYSESEPSSTTASDVPKSDIPAPDYGYNYYSYGHGHMPYPPPPQGYPGYPPQPYDMMGYQQPQYNYGMYPPQGYPPPPQGYPQGPYDYQPPPHPQAPVYPGYPPYPPQQYPPPPQGMYPPPGAPPPAPGYDYGYGAPHGAAPPPAAPYYPGH